MHSVLQDKGNVAEQPPGKSYQEYLRARPLMLLYINDITKDIDSPLRMFADDCLLYRIIESTENTTKLQQDLDILSEWANTWQLNFNVTKCAVIRCTSLIQPYI